VTPTVTIRGIVAGGDGVGCLEDGMTVFVPRTAPGDEAKVEVIRRKRRYARGRLVGLARPGDSRVDPPCVHYTRDRCGGCRLQHLSLETQLAVKRELVGEAVRRIGKREAADPPIVASDLVWHYRSQITLAATADAIGLHRLDDSVAVFEMEDCLIVREPVTHLWQRIRPHRDLLPSGLAALVLKEDRSGMLHLVTVGGEEPWNPVRLSRRLAGLTVTYWWQPKRGAARVVAGDGGAFPAVAFEQSNRDLAQAIRVAAVSGLGPIDNAVVWDLYGGVGDTAELLTGRGARAWSVDSNRTALEWARAHGSSSVTRVAGRVEESLGRLPAPRAVVVNPPRTGLAARVSSALESWARTTATGRVAYISCDPATLARDLSRMPSLRLRSLTAYDLFPQTAHVESLALLEAE
jgi:23S rRNA (uracil1939-C5)-methyltransferase